MIFLHRKKKTQHTHTHTHARAHTRMHAAHAAHAHARPHTRMHARTRACTLAHAHARPHTRMHARTRACMHTCSDFQTYCYIDGFVFKRTEFLTNTCPPPVKSCSCMVVKPVVGIVLRLHHSNGDLSVWRVCVFI